MPSIVVMFFYTQPWRADWGLNNSSIPISTDSPSKRIPSVNSILRFHPFGVAPTSYTSRQPLRSPAKDTGIIGKSAVMKLIFLYAS